MTAGRRGGVTKGRGCSPVVRSPFSASIFLLDPRYSTLHRPRGNSIIISGKDVKNFSRNFSFQSRTYRRMISQFFQRSISISSAAVKSSNCQERKEGWKKEKAFSLQISWVPAASSSPSSPQHYRQGNKSGRKTVDR